VCYKQKEALSAAEIIIDFARLRHMLSTAKSSQAE